MFYVVMTVRPLDKVTPEAHGVIETGLETFDDAYIIAQVAAEEHAERILVAAPIAVTNYWNDRKEGWALITHNNIEVQYMVRGHDRARFAPRVSPSPPPSALLKTF